MSGARPRRSSSAPRVERATTDGGARRAPRWASGPAGGAPLAWQRGGGLHPAEVFRALRPFVGRDRDTVLVGDGGEFARWGQSMLPVRRRLVNGVAGAIGCSLPFALAARLVEP